MSREFRSGLDVFDDQQQTLKLTTGFADLDSLLGGGISQTQFYLFYGNDESGINLIIHHLLVNCLLPIDQLGFEGKVVYVNCSNYREQKTLLDSQVLSFLIKKARRDPLKMLDNIYVICAFSEDQQQQIVPEIAKLLEQDRTVKLVVIHNIAQLFMSNVSGLKTPFGRNVPKLTSVVSKLWQTCAQKNVAVVASCRPNKSPRGNVPLPEGGKYLRHEASVIVHFRKLGAKFGEKTSYVAAYLRKHPNRQVHKVTFDLTVGGDVMKRTTTTFSTLLREEINNLTRSYREALLDVSRRNAFDSLLNAWFNEQRAMSYAKTPTALDVMLLTSVLDNRKFITDLSDQIGIIDSQLDKIQHRLQRIDKE